MLYTFEPFDWVEDVAAEIEMAMQLGVVASPDLGRHDQMRHADTWHTCYPPTTNVYNRWDTGTSYLKH